MAFFLIVPSVMIVSIVLIHALANRLGLRIYYATLIAAAVLAFMADFAATLVAPEGGREFLLRLGIMIFAASILLTLANRFLINKQREEEKKFTEEVKAAYQAEIEKNPTPVPTAPLDKFTWEEEPPPPKYNEAVDSIRNEDASIRNEELGIGNDSAGEEIKSDSVAETTEEPAQTSIGNEELGIGNNSADEETKSDSVAETSDEPAKLSAASEPEEKPVDLAEKRETNDLEEIAKLAEPFENPEPPEDFPLEEVFEPLPEVKREEVDPKVEMEKKIQSEKKFPLEEVFEPLPEVKREEVQQPEKIPKRVELFPLQEVFKPLSNLRLDKIEQMTREEKKSSLPENDSDSESESEEKIETLDDILDKAYTERAKGHIWQAIDLYNKALERYRNDDYAPFVAIDLGNLYKEQAFYSKAIKSYEDALNLPAVKRNAATQKDFATNLAYLRVLRDVLLKRQAMSTPFDKLPKEILQEADAEFQKAQFHSAQSR